jgi:hypothetical protein
MTPKKARNIRDRVLYNIKNENLMIFDYVSVNSIIPLHIDILLVTNQAQ